MFRYDTWDYFDIFHGPMGVMIYLFASAMMTSWNGNIFRVTGHLCGEFTPVNSPHKGQWRGALMFSLICVWINGWVNKREAGDVRRHRAQYDVIVMHGSVQSRPHTTKQPSQNLTRTPFSLARLIFLRVSRVPSVPVPGGVAGYIFQG